MDSLPPLCSGIRHIVHGDIHAVALPSLFDTTKVSEGQWHITVGHPTPALATKGVTLRLRRLLFFTVIVCGTVVFPLMSGALLLHEFSWEQNLLYYHTLLLAGILWIGALCVELIAVGLLLFTHTGRRAGTIYLTSTPPKGE